MSGQSNSVGAGFVPSSTQDNNVPFAWYLPATFLPGYLARGWGPLEAAPYIDFSLAWACEATLGPDLYAAGHNVAIAKWAYSGQAIDYFLTNWTTIRDWFIARKAELPAGSSWGPLIWQQGESDAVNTTLANAYAGKLTTLAANYRAMTGATSKIVIVQLDPAPTGFPQASIVRAQQASFVAGDANAVLVPYRVGWTKNSDGVHYDYVGQQAIGHDVAPVAF